MVIFHKENRIPTLQKEKQIPTLEDIQKLKVNTLKEILRSNSESTRRMKADLILKVYAILMRNVVVWQRIARKMLIITRITQGK